MPGKHVVLVRVFGSGPTSSAKIKWKRGGARFIASLLKSNTYQNSNNSKSSNPHFSAKGIIIYMKYATLVGCAIGDALGNPFETKPVSYPPLIEWDGTFKEGGTFWWGQPGQYTDDTLMSLCLARSLARNQRFNPVDVANEYLAWYISKNTRGIGGTTAQAMINLKAGMPWYQSGITGDHIGGNGTAMRAPSIGLFFRNNLNACVKAAHEDAIITHNSIEPITGSIAIASGVAQLANGSNPLTVLENVAERAGDTVVGFKLNEVLKHLEAGTNVKDALKDIGSQGYVPETVGAAYYCLLVNNNFRDTVVMAVKAGGDTDTTAAIAGAMAGTLYGLDQIPDQYKEGLEDFEMLSFLDQELTNITI